MVQQRSDRRDDLRLSRGDADDHLLRAVEVRINRLFPLSTSFILHAIPRLLLLSSSFFFFFLFLSFFFSFFFGSLDSFEFFAIRRKDEKWDGERDLQNLSILGVPAATQARDTSRPQARVHSFNFSERYICAPIAR